MTIFSFAVFLVVFLWVGALAARASSKTEAGYLLGDRSFGKVFVGLSAGASGNSGWIMVGAVGLAYTVGVSSFLMLIAIFLGELAFWSFYPHRINRISRQQGSETVPEMLGMSVPAARGRRFITSLAALIIVVFIGAYTAAQFSAAAKILHVFFGIRPELGAWIVAVAILVYCVQGGFTASVWTDVVQAFVVMLVAFGVLAAAVIAAGGAGAVVEGLERIDPELLQLTSGRSAAEVLGYGLAFVLLGFGFNLSQPHVLVRLLAGRDPEETRAARWIYLGYAYSTWAAMLLFGLTCRVLIAGLDDPEQALAAFAVEYFHPILVGVVLAGVFSVIASTADSQILVCSSALARDLSPSFSRGMKRRFGWRYQQLMTLLFGSFAVVAALYLTSTVFSLVLFAIGGLTSSVGPAMFITVMEWRTRPLALGVTMVVGLSISVAWRLLEYHTLVNEALPSFVIALAIHQLLMRTVWPEGRTGGADCDTLAAREP